MANVNIKFNNKDYLLSCDDGQEESLKNLTKFLDKKYNELKDKLGNIGENKLLLITTIQLIDDYFDLKQRVAQQKRKIDELASKFKEIKKIVLVFNKKDIKRVKSLKLKNVKLIAGGNCRQQSTLNALRYLKSQKGTPKVLIHDVARPNFSTKLLTSILKNM